MLKLITAPTAEPITTQDAKDWLRISTTADDSLLDLMIKSARQKVENITGRKLITQTWELWLDHVPGNPQGEWWDGTRDGHIGTVFSPASEIDLKLAPVQSVSSLTYYDLNNTSATFSSSAYLVDTVSSPARLILNSGQVWPQNLRDRNAIAVRMIAGYGDSGSFVPDSLLSAIKCTVMHFYEHRGDEYPNFGRGGITGEHPGVGGSLPVEAMTFLEPYIVRRLV